MQDPNTENTQPTRPERDMGETVPTRAQREEDDLSLIELTRPSRSSAPKIKKARRWPWVLLGIVFMLLFAGAGAWLGYNSALQMRKAKAAENKVTVATEHFMLGIQAQAKKQYEIARQQFEYVIKLDPTFPGASDKLREVMIAMAVVNSPTPAPTKALPTLTPTVDTRPQEEIYNQARAQFASKDWTGLFATIDSLRKIDPKYKAVEIDDMLYVALRYRGVDKILRQANLEGGMYDLALAEQFGPLDVDAAGYRQWARYYLNGASFWEIDWLKVVDAFEQIYPYFPNMIDSSGMTALERYRIAAKSYADQLMTNGDACKAFDYYQKSLNASADAQVEATATAVYLVCHPPTATPTETSLPPTLAPTVEAPTAEPPPAEPTMTVTPTSTTAPSGGGIIKSTPTPKGK